MIIWNRQINAHTTINLVKVAENESLVQNDTKCYCLRNSISQKDLFSVFEGVLWFVYS